MIVRCPECSTGFKLPRDQVADDGVKLRCSKCSHVFRFRIDGDGETEIFYNDSDRERNAQIEGDQIEGDQVEGDQAEGDQVEGDADDDSPADTPDDEWEQTPQTQVGTPGRAVSKDASSKEKDVAPEDGNKTAFGMPSAKKEPKKKSKAKKKTKKRSKSASSDYNPFPHANLDLTSKQDSSSFSDIDDDQDTQSPQEPTPDSDLDWDGDEATRVEHDSFGDEAAEKADQADQADAFDGAFDDDEDDDSAGTMTEGAPDSSPATTPPADATKADPSASSPAPTQAATATAPARQPTEQKPPKDAAAPVAAAEAAAATAKATARADEPELDQPAQEDQNAWQTDNAYSPEEMVDPSFGEGGPSFDPDQGVVTPNQPASNQPASNQPASNQPAGNQPTGDKPAPKAQQPPAAAQTSRQRPASTGASTPASAKAEANWDVDSVDDSLDPIEPHTVGGSGIQKVANFALISLLVVVGFLGLLAALSGWVLDFKRFPHMLEVAFESAEFEPREEWTGGAAPEVAVAPEAPVRFSSVFATVVALEGSDEAVILVRGNAENISELDFNDVVVRGMLHDQNERTVAQTKAPLGGRLIQSEIAQASSSDEASALLPTDAASLSGGSTQPFSLVFSDVPKKVLANPDVLYSVEVADSNPPTDQRPEPTTDD